MKEQDILSMEVDDERINSHHRKKWVHYEVLAVYKYFVLCQRYAAGYRECFGYFDIAKMIKSGKARIVKG